MIFLTAAFSSLDISTSERSCVARFDGLLVKVMEMVEGLGDMILAGLGKLGRSGVVSKLCGMLVNAVGRKGVVESRMSGYEIR